MLVTQGFLLTEEFKMHFNSMFTREDISSVTTPETKLNGPKKRNVPSVHCNPTSNSLHTNFTEGKM